MMLLTDFQAKWLAFRYGKKVECNLKENDAYSIKDLTIANTIYNKIGDPTPKIVVIIKIALIMIVLTLNL